nr:MAG TPA: putative outer membrane protein [Caudoviricetes sp.]
MKTNKLTLLTVATIATATLGIKGVNANESDRGITSETTTIATNKNGEANGTESTVSTTETNQPANSSNDAGAGSAETENNEREGLPTNITKDGDQIRVENPNVSVEQPEGNGRYTPFKVKYDDVKIPDNIEVNEGDKVTFDLPDVVKFQTSYEFDVHNPEKEVVGKATADANTNKVTTVFNDYFKSHPLNKSMSLELDASWTDKVEAGKPVIANFNGTVVTANVGSEGVIGKDELVTKWGEQDKADPTVINWTARVNYAKRVLNYVTIIDEMSENQKLVDNYFEIKNIESLNPWIEKGSAMDLVKSISKSDHGFAIKMDRLDHMIYLYYKTKLTNAVKDSTNPTNKIELKAEDANSVAYQKIQLVGGKGDAVGEDKPVWEIPNDAPKYDKPSININEIPLMPPAPILDKPYLPIEDIPLLPPAPILYKPELVIDIPEPKRDEPKPQPKEDKPNTPAPKETPKVEEVKITNLVENHAQNTRNESEETVKAYSAPATLPNTGSEFGIAISLLGMLGLSLGVAGMAKKEN